MLLKWFLLIHRIHPKRYLPKQQLCWSKSTQPNTNIWKVPFWMRQYFRRKAIVYAALPKDRTDQLHDKCGKHHNNHCNRCMEFLPWQTYLAHRKEVHSSRGNFCTVYFHQAPCNTSHRLWSCCRQDPEYIGMIQDHMRDKWSRCIPVEWKEKYVKLWFNIFRTYGNLVEITSRFHMLSCYTDTYFVHSWGLNLIKY